MKFQGLRTTTLFAAICLALCSGPMMASAMTYGLQEPATEAKNEADALSIGHKAPAIDIEHWVQNGDGKFQPVKSFQEGKVYVVEFWATWCPPCIASMPHLAKLQQEYASRGVTIISVSDEELDVVTEFLKRPAANEDSEKEDAAAKTFNDVTKPYCLTTDPDQSVYKDYMVAANQNGIPTAFIVGKKGVIEWIGHPMEMDDPLEQVVSDKWDREKFVAEFKAMEEMQARLGEIFGLLRDGKTDEAVKLLDEVISKSTNNEMKQQLKVMKFELLIGENVDEAAKLFDELVTENATNGDNLNALAWTVFEMKKQEVKVPEALAKSALRASELAAKAKPDDGMILDTYAHWLHVHGELDKAIEVQTRALKNPGPAKEEIEAFLKELNKEKADKGK